MTSIQAILVLVAAVWGSYGVVIKAFEFLNRKRDTIITGRDRNGSYSLHHRKLMFLSDFIPMQASVVIFMAILFILLWNVPYFVIGEHTDKIRTISRITSLVPFSGLVGYLFGGIKDIVAVNRTLIVYGKRCKQEDKEIDQDLKEIRKQLKSMEGLFIFLILLIFAGVLLILLPKVSV